MISIRYSLFFDINMNSFHINRHKTAIKRYNFSKPVKLALDSNILNSKTTFFDYGCGHGDDIKLLKSLGLKSEGWDPVHRPKSKLLKSDVVNLGYVLNVIEEKDERNDVISNAWKLTNKVLIVSCRLVHEIKDNSFKSYKDGFFTKTGTFQKFYTQNELKDFIEINLKKRPISIAPGIFLVFRDEIEKQRFEASLYRIKRLIAPRKSVSEKLYEDNKDLLDNLLEFFYERGRIPENTEISYQNEIQEKFGSIKKAFTVIKRVKDNEELNEVKLYKAQDLIVYLALINFDGRPKKNQLPAEIQLDIRALFGTYKNACCEADALLYSLGEIDTVRKMSSNLSSCKVTQSAIYLHKSSLSQLPTLIRLYEGCARKYIGEIEEANIIKLNLFKPKISYLIYPDFDKVAHPALLGSMVVSFRDRDITFHNYSNSDNPPILHRKEIFVPQEYPNRSKFEKLTKQEEKHGLLDKSNNIGLKNEWEELLKSKGLCIRGHTVKRISDS